MLIGNELREQLEQRLKKLTGDVNILFFTQELECQYCRETGELLKELSEVSPSLKLEIKNLMPGREETLKYNIDKIPAIVPLDKDRKDYGIRFYGIPGGYEFTSLLESIIMLGTGNTGLNDELIEQIKSIEEPVHLQVFVTPTCPYCPRAVATAHRLAYLNVNIKADMIEATEFPQLIQKYNVRGVPRTVINEHDFIEGQMPEEMVIDRILDNIHKVKAENEAQ